jgi:hypothetical protein
MGKGFKKTMRNHLIIFTALIGLLTLSCKSSPQPSEQDLYFYLGENQLFKLLPTYHRTEPLEIQQFIEGYYGSEEYFMQAFVQLNQENIQISALSALGTSLFQLNYNNERIDFSATGPFPKETALYMLATIELCYFPQEALEQWFLGSELQFEEQQTLDGWIRIINQEDTTILKIIRDGDHIEMHNYHRNYGFNIQEIIQP